MKLTTIGSMRSFWITLALSATTTAALATPAQPGKDSAVLGNWQISIKANSAEKRLVTLNKQKGQLGGFYTTKAGRKVPITGAKYAKNILSFQVPSVRLQFRNVRFVKGILEGEVIDANPGKMASVPMPVRLVRARN
jgi:hypothetical protein